MSALLEGMLPNPQTHVVYYFLESHFGRFFFALATSLGNTRSLAKTYRPARAWRGSLDSSQPTFRYRRFLGHTQ
jgi:hypothetical protein